MWLVHSLDPGTDLQPGDLRRRLIEHVRDPGRHLRELAQQLARVESVFEEQVLQALVANGYRVRTQVQVGFYRIDMIVENSQGKKIALECDGERFHPPERIPADMAREAVLERLGWTFVRVRGSRWFRDSEASLREIIEELNRLGVDSLGPEPSGDVQAGTSELKDRVIRRAFEIMRAGGFIDIGAQPTVGTVDPDEMSQ
jgi:very-short-patch-repair endonuclease